MENLINPYACATCFEAFEDTTALVKHVEAVHLANEISTESENKPKSTKKVTKKAKSLLKSKVKKELKSKQSFKLEETVHLPNKNNSEIEHEVEGREEEKNLPKSETSFDQKSEQDSKVKEGTKIDIDQLKALQSESDQCDIL